MKSFEIILWSLLLIFAFVWPLLLNRLRQRKSDLIDDGIKRKGITKGGINPMPTGKDKPSFYPPSQRKPPDDCRPRTPGAKPPPFGDLVTEIGRVKRKVD